MKYASIKHLACALVAALAFPAAALAATPVAVWDYAIDGQQLNTTQNGLTVNAGPGNSFVDGKLNIAGSGYYSGGYIDLPENLANVSVLVKYSDFSGFSGHSYAPVFMCVRDSDKYELGLLATDNATTFVWYWYLTGGDPTITPDQHRTGSPAFVPASGYMLFSYKTTWGLRLCSGTSLSNMTTEEKSGYNFSGRTIKQIGIGGAPDYAWSDGWPNLVIEKVALFTNEFLSASDVASFQFPSMSASEINAKFGDSPDIDLELADGTFVIGDTTFNATNINFVCNGSFTILPPTNNATAFGFSGVTGSPVMSYTGALPSVSGDRFTASSIPTNVANAADWTGTIWLRDITVTDFNVNSYGNQSSLVRLTGIDGWLTAPGNYTYLNSVPVELSDEGSSRGYALKITNGNSANEPNPLRCTAFVKIKGDGTIVDNTSAMPVIKVFDFSEFSGSISFNSACLVVCDTATSYDSLYNMFNEHRGALRVESGKTVNMAPGKTWKFSNINFYGSLSAPAGTSLGSPTAVAFDGTANFTTDTTDYNGLVLFRNIGTRQTVHFGNNAVIKVNGEDYDRALYSVKIKNSNLMLVDRRVFTIHIR